MWVFITGKQVEELILRLGFASQALAKSEP